MQRLKNKINKSKSKNENIKNKTENLNNENIKNKTENLNNENIKNNKSIKKNLIIENFETLKFSNDIIFLLQNYFCNLKSNLVLISDFKYDYPCKFINNKGSARSLEYFKYQVLDEKLNFYRNLKNLKLHDVKKVYMNSFNDLVLEKFTLKNNILLFVWENIANFKVTTLELIDMCFSISDFINLLIFCNPSELILIRVHIKNLNYLNLSQILKTLNSLNLLSFKVKDSFLDFNLFKKILLENNIKNFFYQKENIDLFFISQSPYIKSCIGSNDLFFLNHTFFEEIEFLRINSKDLLFSFMNISMNLKYLLIENLEFDCNIIKILLPVKNLIIIDCFFKNTSFYELIRKMSGKTKLFVFKKTLLPLNSLEFLKNENLNCKVIIDNNIFFNNL